MKFARHERSERRAQMRARGVIPRNKSVIYEVVLSVIAVPDWAKERAIKGRTLDPADGVLWIKSKRLANLLGALDRKEGGTPIVMPVEARRCPTCRRMVIGKEAEELRKRMQSLSGPMETCDSLCMQRRKQGAA